MTDIRTMSREEISAINERGRVWRDRNKPAQDDQTPEVASTMQSDLERKRRNE